MSDVELLNPVSEQLSASAEEIRYTAIKYLVKLNSVEAVPLLIKAVEDSSCRIREEAIKGITSFPRDITFPKLEVFLRNNGNATLRNAAISAFPRYGKEATPYLLRLLKDKDEEVRMFSAQILGDIKDPAAVDDLIEALKDPDENVKHAAAESLGKIGDARAVNPLVECLEQDFWLQYPVVTALGKIGDPSATAHLIELLDNEMLQQSVIEALGKIGDESVVQALGNTLSRSDTSIRNDIIASLVNIQRIIKPGGACLPSIKKTLGSGEMIGHLMDSLQDSDLEVRKNAITVLGWLREERAVKELVKLLTDYELEECVIGSLVSIGEKALNGLSAALSNPDPRVQMLLIRCMEWIGHVDGIKACIPFLKNENAEVRCQAVMAMAGALDSAEVEDELLALLSDPEPEIRELLIEIMGKSRSATLADKLLGELPGNDYLRKYLAVQILGRLKNPIAFKPLKELMEDKDDKVRAEAYKALSAIYPAQLSQRIVTKGLKDKSSVVRKAVAHCIEANPGKNVENDLYSLLKDPDPGVRLAAIETLGKTGNASSVEALTHDFANCNKQLQLAIIRALGNIHHKDSTQFLIDLLKEADPDLKRTAIESLGGAGDKRSVPDLIVALDDPGWSVRSAAIQALTKVGDQKIAIHLIKKLDDPEDIIKKEAIFALGYLKPTGVVNHILPLIYNENLQLTVLSALERLGIPDLDFFYDFFERSNARLKCLLVDLLGWLKDPRATDFLCKVLKNEFVTVRCRAAKSLGKLGDRKAIPVLLDVRRKDQSEDVRKEVAMALKILDGDK